MKHTHPLLPLMAMTALGVVPTWAATKRPNIVLIISDDTRMLDFGCYGSPDAVTPNIDRLAREGLRFTGFFQATAMSSPTRHCLLTGLYPVRSGAYPNHTFLNPGVRTLPQYLKDLGYRVAMQGKRHIAPMSAFPFEELAKPNANVNPERIELFLREMAHSREPFFLYVASHDAHAPWTRGDQSLFDPERLTLPPTLVDTPQVRELYARYLAEIQQLDTDVGRIDRLLKKYGLDDDTVLIFTSEQGHQFPFAKWTCYDAGLQTAFIIRWNGVTQPGSSTQALCEYVDVTPTLIDIAGGTPPRDLDGRSFREVIEGKRSTHKQRVYGIQTSNGIINGPDYYGIRSVRDDRYCYIRNLTPEARFQCVVTRQAYFQEWEQLGAAGDSFARQRASLYQKRPAEELYDIQADPYQMHNLADDPRYGDTIARMRAELDAWMESQGDKGQQTELEARKHLLVNREKQSRNPPKSLPQRSRPE